MKAVLRGFGLNAHVNSTKEGIMFTVFIIVLCVSMLAFVK